jgi:hypothetical protein
MSVKQRTGGVRTVIQLSQENAVSVFAALTPPGADKPPFGLMSRFFNQLVEAWRVKQAQKENQRGTHEQPST